jgi:putative colanic acid biosynthesis UDP-glucose lipid carrier transferase
MIRRGLFKEYAAVMGVVARFLDVLAIIAAAVAAFQWRFSSLDMPGQYLTAIVIAMLLTPSVFSAFGIYHSWRGKGGLALIKQVTLAVGAVFLALQAIAFVTKSGHLISRQWFIAWAVSAWVIALMFRGMLAFLLRNLRKRGWNHKHIVIVGAGTLGLSVALRMAETSWTGFEVVGFFDDKESLQGQQLEGLSVLGSTMDIPAFVQQRQIDEVWLTLPLREEERVNQIVHSLRYSTVNIRFVPDMFSFRLLNHSVTEIAGLPMLDISATPMIGINRIIKAIEDRILAAVILLLISPLLLLLMIGVKLTSPGPVLFKQLRYGWDGKSINVYKFRSMMIHEEEGGAVTQASRNDSRVTRFGAFLRRTSLDELPQFYNVLQGRMSIVGPRPHAIAHNEQYKEIIDDYMKRHKVKPGITGWAQVNGWRGETDTLEKMQKRVEYDLYYIEHWSLWFDLRIIVMTVFRLFSDKNAY